MSTIIGMPGGALENSLSTTAVAVDLAALARMEVKIWCEDADIRFCFTSSAETSTTLVDSGDQAASTTALVADSAAMSIGVIRAVSPKYTRLVVKTTSGTGTLRIKSVAEASVNL